MLFLEECLRETLYFQKNILSLFITDFGHPNLIILILFWLVPRRTYHGTASAELWCCFPLWARDCSLHPTFLGPLICRRLLYIYLSLSEVPSRFIASDASWPWLRLGAIQQSRTQAEPFGKSTARRPARQPHKELSSFDCLSSYPASTKPQPEFGWVALTFTKPERGWPPVPTRQYRIYVHTLSESGASKPRSLTLAYETQGI